MRWRREEGRREKGRREEGREEEGRGGKGLDRGVFTIYHFEPQYIMIHLQKLTSLSH